MHKKLFITGTISALLVVSTLSAQVNCVGNACFIDIKDITPPKVSSKKSNSVIISEKQKFVNSKSEFKSHISEKNIVKEVDESYDVVIDGKVTVVFPSYVMTPEEKAAYYREHLNNELGISTKPMEEIENKILNKELPVSEYFCDNNKKPVKVENSELYECV